MADVAQQLREGRALLHSGRLDEARRVFEAIIAAEPADSRGHYMLGIVERAAGHPGAAIPHFDRAADRALDDAEVHYQLAECLRLTGNRDRAGDEYRLVLALQRNHSGALAGLGDLAFEGGELRAAADRYARVVALGEGPVRAYWRLGIALVRTDRAEAALDPLGRALERSPDDVNVLMALGEAKVATGDLKGGLKAFEDALQRRPGRRSVLVNLAKTYRILGRLTDAVALLRRARKAWPEDADIRANLGLLLQMSGDLDDALAELDEGVKRDPIGLAASNRLLAMHYVRREDAASLAAAHRDWGVRVMATREAGFPPHENGPEPERRLRIGYVSPDLRQHPVRYFLGPIMRHHDHDAFEVHAFANVERSDGVTASFRNLFDRWHDISGTVDDGAAASVRAARIDILVDLAGHTGGHRLGVFARRPAPVQATYLGYPDTTGLPTIDYRLTDAVADPPGPADTLSVEKLVRLSPCFLCYEPDPRAPEVTAPPAASAPGIVFGSFNNLSKVSEECLRLWARVLAQVPDSRLLIKGTALMDAGVADRFSRRAQAAGIPGDRLILVPPVNAKADHFGAYSKIDIALDTFPYNGTTTTFEALWMGVPVISLAGDTHVSRVGASILHTVGLGALATESADAYVATARSLAADRRQLVLLRDGLRRRLAASPLLDGAGFVRGLEAAYREMWRRWCSGPDGA